MGFRYGREKTMFKSAQWPAFSSSDAGFTIIELIVAIALMGVLFAIAVPTFRDLVADQNVRTAAATLHSSILQARAEAIKRNQTVRLRPGSGEEWTDGWLIPNPATPASDSSPVRRERLKGAVEVTTDADQIDFRASGRLSGGAAVTFELESVSDSSKKRCITISLDGRAQTARGGC